MFRVQNPPAQGFDPFSTPVLGSFQFLLERDFFALEHILLLKIPLAFNVPIEENIHQDIELPFSLEDIHFELPDTASRGMGKLSFPSRYPREHVACPCLGKGHTLKLFPYLLDEQIFLHISLTTLAELLGTAIVTISAAAFAGRPLRRHHCPALPTAKVSGKGKVMLLARPRRPASLGELLLHRFKECRCENGRKASGKPFFFVLSKSEIRSIGENTFDGSFAKGRSGLGTQATVKKKLRCLFECHSPFGVLLICSHNGLGLHRMRFDVPLDSVVHISKGGF